MTSNRSRARSAFLVVLGILAVLWIIQIINNADHYQLSIDYSIQPRIVSALPYILTAPFLHWSWQHIEGNSIPLVILGFLAAYRSIPKFLGVTAIVLLTSGMVEWTFGATGSLSAGASGVIFGWFGYVMVRGFFTHNKIDVVLGIAVMIYYLPIFTLLLPAPHLGYQDHIGGLVGGLSCGWILRTRTDGVDTGVDSESPRSIQPTSPASPFRHVEAELAALKKQIVSEGRHLADDKDNDKDQ
jgi:membrane associated rhomboid family serine protease